MIYGVVPAAGLYYSALGLGSEHVPAGRVAGFAAVMGLLFALEAVQRRWPPPGGSPSATAALLAARLGLFVAAAALDPSGESRVLFVLVPFAAYFAFGRAASLGLAAVCLILLVAGFMLRVPHWYTQAVYLSDVLMFAVGLILAIAMASVAVAEQARAAQVAGLSAEAERTRLARDIHDSLGHHLTAIAVQLEKAAAFRDRDPGDASLLGIQAGITVVGTASDGAQAVEQALALAPDIILMDVRMPGTDGVLATAQVRRELPACQVITLTTFDDEDYVVRALRAGAAGYLLKDLPATELASAVRLAHAGSPSSAPRRSAAWRPLWPATRRRRRRSRAQPDRR